MKEILEKLIRLAPGEYDMEEVAKAIDEKRPPYQVGLQVMKLDGIICDGVRVRIIRGGGRRRISLDNVIGQSSPDGGSELDQRASTASTAPPCSPSSILGEGGSK